MNHNIRHQILQYISQYHSLSVNEISQMCGISLPTARKYLQQLDKEQLLKFHRGVVSKITNYVSPVLVDILEKQKDSKLKIGQFAASLVNDNDTIFIGAGSTTTYMLEHLIEKKHLTIITNSIHVENKMILHPNVTLLCVGGQWNPSTLSFENKLFKYSTALTPDKAFIGAPAIDIEHGITYRQDSINESEFDMFQNSKAQYVLVDHTKIGTSRPWNALDSDKIPNIITDILPKKDIANWQKLGVNILLAD